MTRRALVVDDSMTMREMVSRSLRESGFETLTAGNGQEGLRVLEGTRVDLIISDVNMPVMDGLSFLENVRASQDLKFTPILMLTTESGVGMKERAKALGATGWLVKPFNPEMLQKVIARVVP